MYLAGSPQKGSAFQVRVNPPSGDYVKSVEINATIIFGGLWVTGSKLTLSTVYTNLPLVTLTKNDIINATSVDLGCGGGHGAYAYHLSVEFYFLSNAVKMGEDEAELMLKMITATGDSAWVAIRDVYLTYQTAPPYDTCPSKTYRPSTAYTRDPCVCKLKK